LQPECKNEALVSKTYQHTCPSCGKEFESHSTSSRLCDECRTVECATCGTKFLVKSSRIETAKYCSDECRSRGKRSYDWTAKDEEFVRQNYPHNISQGELAEKYGVSRSAVQRLVIRLDLPEVPPDIHAKHISRGLRQWTDERVIAEIQRLHVDEQINSSYIQQNHRDLYYAANQYLGSWGAAVEASGIDYSEVNLYANRRTWTTQDILNEIVTLYDQARRGPESQQCS
jgi:hypothetical protein